MSVQEHQAKKQRVASHDVSRVFYAKHAHDLRVDGYTVLPFAVYDCGAFFAEAVREDMEQYPEFKRSASDDMQKYVMGAFGAFGNPASFHSKGVREVRAQANDMARSVFRAMYADDADRDSLVCEQLFDRVVQRHVGDSLSHEKWHRDTTPKVVRLPRAVDNELYSNSEIKIRERTATATNVGTLYGGWVNLSDRNVNQKFVCVPGTHTQKASKEGFGTLSKQETEHFGSAKRIVTIPPGYWLLFNQNIVHQVRSYKVRAPELRVHIAFNISRGKPRALFGDVYKKRVIRDLETPLIPSGQIPPLFSPNHLACFSNRLSDWARACLHERFVYTHTFSSKASRAGQEIRVPYRFIIRHDLSCSIPRYSKIDIHVLTPLRLF